MLCGLGFLEYGPTHNKIPLRSGSVLTGTVVALEAILLASFILMRQARTSRRADERDHLMLQILLLIEKEITTVLSMDRQIAKQVGLEKLANSADVRELSEHTSIEDVAEIIKEAMLAEE